MTILNRLKKLFKKWFQSKDDDLTSMTVQLPRIAIGYGGSMRPNGLPSLLTEAVAEECARARLFFLKPVEIIIFSGGLKTNGTSEAMAMKEIAVRLGVPQENIYLEEASLNTRQNSLYAAKLIEEIFKPDAQSKHLQIVIVAHQYHINRAFPCFKKVASGYWHVLRRTAWGEFDPLAIQKRIHSKWRYLCWNILSSIYFKLKRWT